MKQHWSYLVSSRFSWCLSICIKHILFSLLVFRGNDDLFLNITFLAYILFLCSLHISYIHFNYLNKFCKRLVKKIYMYSVLCYIFEESIKKFRRIFKVNFTTYTGWIYKSYDFTVYSIPRTSNKVVQPIFTKNILLYSVNISLVRNNWVEQFPIRIKIIGSFIVSLAEAEKQMSRYHTKSYVQDILHRFDLMFSYRVT